MSNRMKTNWSSSTSGRRPKYRVKLFSMVDSTVNEKCTEINIPLEFEFIEIPRERVYSKGIQLTQEPIQTGMTLFSHKWSTGSNIQSYHHLNSKSFSWFKSAVWEEPPTQMKKPHNPRNDPEILETIQFQNPQKIHRSLQRYLYPSNNLFYSDATFIRSSIWILWTL